MRIAVLVVALAAGLFDQPPGEFNLSFPAGDLGYFSSASAPSDKPSPLLVLLASGLESGAARAALDKWRGAASARGWLAIAPYGQYKGKEGWGDGSVLMLEAVLKDTRSRLGADPAHVYLVAFEAATPMAFYVASRAPDLIAAAIAVEGNPGDAIATNRLFGANTALAPVLWAIEPPTQSASDPYLRKLKSVSYNVVIHSAQGLTESAALDWLARRRLDPYPLKVDCETGSLEFNRCYWVRITRFDAGQRNDALETTRVPPGSGAYLALGGFGYKTSAPGPGVPVEWLPENYKGPLKLRDRIVSVAGRAVEDPASYIALMEEMIEEKNVAIMVQRGKERVRLETRIMLPKREEVQTARVQAEYFPDTKEVLVISRQVAELRLDLPAHFLPARLNWNGNDAGPVDRPGCWLLAVGAQARACGE